MESLLNSEAGARNDPPPPSPGQAAPESPGAHLQGGGAKLGIQDVSIAYVTQGTRREAVNNVSLEVRNGEFLTLVGPSGCGKSTLLKAVAGLIPIQSGVIEIQKDDAAAFEQAMVFQEPRLLPWRRALANIMYPLESLKMGTSERRDVALAELERVGLLEAADLFPGQLSGGMQQRVNLARALVVDPEVLLLDEPFAALDAQTRERMQLELLRIWHTKRKTAVFVTHQVDEAIYLADRVAVMSKGPGNIKTVFEVPFGRPRPLELKRTPEFHELEVRIWQSIDRPDDPAVQE